LRLWTKAPASLPFFFFLHFLFFSLKVAPTFIFSLLKLHLRPSLSTFLPLKRAFFFRKGKSFCFHHSALPPRAHRMPKKKIVFLVRDQSELALALTSRRKKKLKNSAWKSQYATRTLPRLPSSPWKTGLFCFHSRSLLII
jgi:hypothetical protein